MDRVCYGPSFSWVEFVMGRVIELPLLRVRVRGCAFHRQIDDQMLGSMLSCAQDLCNSCLLN